MATMVPLPQPVIERAEPYERFPVDKLLLDWRNPRLAEYGVQADVGQSELLKILWQKVAIEELAMSITYNGYFIHEPLLLEDEGDNYVVIEGNRRLAAVKLLLDETLRERLRATDLPPINRERQEELAALPGLVTTRKKVWRYLGFKHVNGPSSYSSYSKARYIAALHDDYGVSLEDIARQVGDRNSTVERMYRGLMVIDQAERAGLFDRRETSKPSFHFSYIYTALDYPGFKSFLGFDAKGTTEREPVPKSRLKQLGEVCAWLYGDSLRDKPSLIQSQNLDLKILDSVLMSKAGVEALREGLPLGLAKDISPGDDKLSARRSGNRKRTSGKRTGH